MNDERHTENLKISKNAFIALRKAIRYLAFRDSDHATKKNRAGFNKADSKIGHTLARKEKWTQRDVHKAIELAHRYRRQLPEKIRKALPKIKGKTHPPGKKRKTPDEFAGPKENMRSRKRKRKKDFVPKHGNKQDEI
ncbi:MAG TPA: hypothetical protein EYP14_15120 [Planctomycetaceae bacterium]|nr:hypothetical protein [Planctomycetaceae bacterium]